MYAIRSYYALVQAEQRAQIARRGALVVADLPEHAGLGQGQAAVQEPVPQQPQHARVETVEPAYGFDFRSHAASSSTATFPHIS